MEISTGEFRALKAAAADGVAAARAVERRWQREHKRDLRWLWEQILREYIRADRADRELAEIRQPPAAPPPEPEPRPGLRLIRGGR